MAQRQSSIERDIAADCFQSGSAKVVDYLLRLGGAAIKSGRQLDLELEIPKHVLAARMGFTPETLSRIFRELSDAGMILVNGRQVTLTEAFCRTYASRSIARCNGAATTPRFQTSQGGNWFATSGAGRRVGGVARGY